MYFENAPAICHRREELEGEGPVAEALEEARRKEAAAAQQGEGARQGSDPTHAQ